jgi:thioredoxin reductase
VINATGIGMHPNIPSLLSNLPKRLASHVSNYAVQAFPKDANIAVVGGAQSALEYALEAEKWGNKVTLYVRDVIMYRNLHEPSQLLYRFLATYCEYIIRILPNYLKTRLLNYLLEGTCEPELKDELKTSDIDVLENTVVNECYLINDDQIVVVENHVERQFDRLVVATGYYYDIHHIEYLSSFLNDDQHVLEERFPKLDRNGSLKNAPPGMYFIGYSSIYSVGFKAQFINGTCIIVRRVIDDIKRRM